MANKKAVVKIVAKDGSIIETDSIEEAMRKVHEMYSPSVQPDARFAHKHDCAKCEGNGSCSIQPIIEYQNSHPDDKHPALRGLGCLSSTTVMAVLTDALYQNLDDPTEAIFFIALAYGYILGKGGVVKEVMPNQKRMASVDKLFGISKHEADLP